MKYAIFDRLHNSTGSDRVRIAGELFDILCTLIDNERSTFDALASAAGTASHRRAQQDYVVTFTRLCAIREFLQVLGVPAEELDALTASRQ